MNKILREVCCVFILNKEKRRNFRKSNPSHKSTKEQIVDMNIKLNIILDYLQKTNQIPLDRNMPLNPPNTIPSHLYNDFTLNGKIPVLSWYINNICTDNVGILNTKEVYEKVFKEIENKTFKYYGDEIENFYNYFENNKLDGKTSLIWGLAGCNCEALSVFYGCEKCYVVDYNKPTCEHEKIEVLSMDELSNNALKVDIAFSYSSFEHDGLGRYGDPINPNGDLIAMQNVKKHLKDDGILLLGVSFGKDCLPFNAHRIYGKIRLPMLLSGFKLLDVFASQKDNNVFENKLGAYGQFLLVLQNIKNETAEIEYLKNSNGSGVNGTNEILFKKINGFIVDSI